MSPPRKGGGYPYALVCLLGLNGLRVSEACSPDAADLGGSRYQSKLRIVGKGGKPAEIPLNPRTQQAIGETLGVRTEGPHDRHRTLSAGAIRRLRTLEESRHGESTAAQYPSADPRHFNPRRVGWSPYRRNQPLSQCCGTASPH